MLKISGDSPCVGACVVAAEILTWARYQASQSWRMSFTARSISARQALVIRRLGRESCALWRRLVDSSLIPACGPALFDHEHDDAHDESEVRESSGA
jgi:hypothetical protein